MEIRVRPGRHQQFDVCATDIDDQDFSLHERPSPRQWGEVTGRAGSRKTLNKAPLLGFADVWQASIPRFRVRETEQHCRQISNRALILRNLLH